jgi:hypothetical protein
MAACDVFLERDLGMALQPGRYDWQPIATAPLDGDLELAVVERDSIHALIFPCRHSVGGWRASETGQRVEVQPTHWRRWKKV